MYNTTAKSRLEWGGGEERITSMDDTSSAELIRLLGVHNNVTEHMYKLYTRKRATKSCPGLSFFNLKLLLDFTEPLDPVHKAGLSGPKILSNLNRSF